MARRQRRSSSGTLRMTRRWGRKKLVARLLDESGEGQLKLMQWAGTASANEVTDLLLAVLRQYPAHDALPSGCLYVGAFLAAALLLGLSLTYLNGAEFLVLPLLPFILCAYVIRREDRRPRIARQAALMLARINNARALPYLVETWREKPTDVRENETVTEEITRLATEACRPETTLHGTAVLRNFVLYQFPLASDRDLTEGETDMFISLLRLLGLTGDLKDRKALETVSRCEGHTPNHALVIETARQMLEPIAMPVITHQAVPLPEIPPQPVQQIQQNQHY